MRRPGLLLLICLLALRMWVGDAMAFASLPAAPDRAAWGASGQVQPACHESGASAPVHLTERDQDARPADHGGPCDACQVCHLPLLAFALQAGPDSPLPQAVHTPAAERFQSAHLAPRLKPPIG